VDTPRGLEGRPSQSLTLAEASALLEAAEASRLHAFIVLCLLTGVRSEEALWIQRELQARERGEAGELRQEHGLVFTTSVGTGMSHITCGGTSGG
jgi:integrase